MLNVFKERKMLREDVERLEDNIILKDKEISRLHEQKRVIEIAKDINEKKAINLENQLKDLNLKYKKRNGSLGGLKKENNQLKAENEALQNRIIEITEQYENKLKRERSKKRVIGVKELRNPELINKSI